MLSREDNELLTQVSRSTPMGSMLRQYWMPAFQSAELPERDGAPLRVRLMGEDLVAYRDTTGQIGLVAQNCPHRGASLFFGRNEEEGLRCVYHGWKFDASGACVDMPNEPPESNFRQKVKVTAYPCRERGGIVWAYMGPEGTPPELPALEWNMVPADQVWVSQRVQDCNWAQALEGGIDSSHSSFLHSQLNPNDYQGSDRRGNLIKSVDKHPRFEVLDTEFGIAVGARRDADEDHYYWRITQFLMPFYTMIPPYGEQPAIGAHAWVPMNDETTMTWTIIWHPTRPLREEELRGRLAGGEKIAGTLPATSEPGGKWRPVANASNDYFIDYEAQRTKRFCGILNGRIQDQAMQESMGTIFDRTREHLGTSDTAVIQARRRWIQSARDLRDKGLTPPGVNTPEAYQVRSIGLILPRTTAWTEAARALWDAKPGVHTASA